MELSTTTSPSTPPRVQILIGKQADGCTYSLHPASERLLREQFSNVRPAPSVFVGYDTRDDFEMLHGPMWGQIALILTGLSSERLDELGGFRIYDPVSKAVVYESPTRS